MSTNVEDSKVVVPFMPSLQHMASVKVAQLLMEGLDVHSLQIVFKKIQRGHLIEDFWTPLFPELKKTSRQEKLLEINKTYNRAQEKLTTIPSHLRLKVMEAVDGLNFGASSWKSQHSHVLRLEDVEGKFFWKSDGSIDGIKTAQHLVIDADIDARKRFHLACIYCFEENIKSLWTQMEASGVTDNLKTTDDTMMRFWVNRMVNGSRVPWRRAAAYYFAPRLFPMSSIERLSAIFPWLRPEERKQFLFSLHFKEYDDRLLCMYSLTAEEEKEILKEIGGSCLYMYLKWPMRTMFRETLQKLWNYIDEFSFQRLLEKISENIRICKNFDELDLFMDLWHSSPNNFKEGAKQIPHIREILDYFNVIENKRKAEDHDQRKSKKKKLV